MRRSSWEARQVTDAAGSPPPGACFLDFTRVVGRGKPLQERLAAAILRYDIFP